MRIGESKEADITYRLVYVLMRTFPTPIGSLVDWKFSMHLIAC
jgi:hypothetical protein